MLAKESKMNGINNSMEKKVFTLRNPIVVGAIFRNSAGPMKATKKWKHKRVRREGKMLIKMGLKEL